MKDCFDEIFSSFLVHSEIRKKSKNKENKKLFDLDKQKELIKN